MPKKSPGTIGLRMQDGITNYIRTIYDETAGVPATTEQLLLSYPFTQMGEATQLPIYSSVYCLVLKRLL